VEDITQGHDKNLIGVDFEDYLNSWSLMKSIFNDTMGRFRRASIWSLIHSEAFSSDRTMQQYCERIWRVEPNEVPKPSKNPLQRVRSKS